MRQNDLTYTQYVNLHIRSQFEGHQKSVIYGQNIVAGSRISGLGAGLEDISGALALNTTNSENSLMGMGFGLSLSGVPSLFLMKQHDFALLGLDQLVNTTNVLRHGRFKSPFLILMVLVDSGFEGPQATLSSLDEFASLSRAPVHFLSTKESIDEAFSQAEEPGLHFMALSQSNMKKKLKESEGFVERIDSFLLYPGAKIEDSPASIALIFFGVNLQIAEEVQISLYNKGISVDLYVVCRLSSTIVSESIQKKLATYRKVVILDTGKSEIHYSTQFALSISQMGKETKIFQRIASPSWSQVSDDSFEFSEKEIIDYVLSGEQ